MSQSQFHALIAACFLLAPLASAQGVPSPTPAPDVTELLRQGLFDEEVNNDDAKAAAAYAAVVDEYDAQRSIAATAMFRLAEIRLKQGDKTQATTLYQRVLTEFPDNDALVKASRDRLASLGASEPSPSPGAPPEKTASIWFEEAEKDAPFDKANAEGFYLRILSEYPATDSFAILSRERLAALEAAASPSPTPNPAAPTQEEVDELAKLRELVTNSPDLLNAVSEEGTPNAGYSPLTLSAERGWLQAAAFLLDNGANVDGPDGGGEPLHAAAQAGDKAMADLLLTRGAKIDAATPDGWTALHAACFYRRDELAAMLLDKGANPNVTFHSLPKDYDDTNRDNGWGPPAPGADVRRMRYLPGTPLLMALDNRDNDLFALLLKHGADVNLSANASPLRGDARSPLLIALGSGDEASARLLLDHGAKLDANSNGSTVLDSAAIGTPQMVPTLLKVGAPQTPDASGESPLFQSVTYLAGGAFQTVGNYGHPGFNSPSEFETMFARYQTAWEALLSHGDDANAKDLQGLTILSAVINHNSFPTYYSKEIIEWLIAHGANINAPNKEGKTPLHIYCENQRDPNTDPQAYQTIAWLIQHGADPKVKDDYGRTPLDCLQLADKAEFEREFPSRPGASPKP
jgi:ankyrin repeat protein